MGSKIGTIEEIIMPQANPVTAYCLPRPFVIAGSVVSIAVAPQAAIALSFDIKVPIKGTKAIAKSSLIKLEVKAIAPSSSLTFDSIIPPKEYQPMGMPTDRENRKSYFKSSPRIIAPDKEPNITPRHMKIVLLPIERRWSRVS